MAKVDGGPAWGAVDPPRRQWRALGAGALAAGEGQDVASMTAVWHRAARLCGGAVTGHTGKSQAKKAALGRRLFRWCARHGALCASVTSLAGVASLVTWR